MQIANRVVYILQLIRQNYFPCKSYLIRIFHKLYLRYLIKIYFRLFAPHTSTLNSICKLNLKAKCIVRVLCLIFSRMVFVCFLNIHWRLFWIICLCNQDHIVLKISHDFATSMLATKYCFNHDSRSNF